jgi:hypothetical protein
MHALLLLLLLLLLLPPPLFSCLSTHQYSTIKPIPITICVHVLHPMEDRLVFASQSDPYVPLSWSMRVLPQTIRSDVQQVRFACSLNLFVRVL